MKKLMSLIVLSLLILGVACTGTNDQPEKEKVPTFLEFLKMQDIDVALKGTGRYQIYQHSQFARDTFLLDTVEGRVWQLVKDAKTGEILWQKLHVEE